MLLYPPRHTWSLLSHFWTGHCPYLANLNTNEALLYQMTNLRKTYEKVWLTKNLGWACDCQKILQKSYEKLKLCKTYQKLTTTLQVSYENVKFAGSDVIRETLCRRLLLIEYFELKITDNQSDNFLRMFLKHDLPFSWENLRKSYLANLQKSYENLKTNLGKNLTKILRSFENRAPASVNVYSREP